MKGVIKKECKICGQPFEAKSAKGVYCSSICRQKDYRRRIAEVVEIGRGAKVKAPPQKISKVTKTPPMPPYEIKDHGTFESIDKRHPLWEPNDPREGSMAFMIKYNCSSYEELEQKNKNK